MPEAAMNEDGGSIFWQNNIRFAWKIFTVETKSVTKCVKG